MPTHQVIRCSLWMSMTRFGKPRFLLNQITKKVTCVHFTVSKSVKLTDLSEESPRVTVRVTHQEIITAALTNTEVQLIDTLMWS